MGVRVLSDFKNREELHTVVYFYIAFILKEIVTFIVLFVTSRVEYHNVNCILCIFIGVLSF